MSPEFIAILKKDIYTAVVANGSLAQKERAIETSKAVFDWCVAPVGQADAKVEAPKVASVKKGRQA